MRLLLDGEVVVVAEVGILNVLLEVSDEELAAMARFRGTQTLDRVSAHSRGANRERASI